jgi:hypothetical protein
MKSLLFVHAHTVLKFVGLLVKDKNNRKAAAWFFETLTDSKYSLESLFRISVQLFFSAIGRFSALILVDFLECSIIARFRNNVKDNRRLPACTVFLGSNRRCRVSELDY